MKTIATTQLPQHVISPTYDRSKLVTKIVHFGFGAFHRAHQGVYTDELANRFNSDWGICEVSLFSGKPLLEQLQAQDHLFSVVEKNTLESMTKIIGCVRESMHPDINGKQAIINKMVEPQVAIVSLTITEKGYCTDTNTGQLNELHPLIKQDLQTPTSPNSVIGYLVQALKIRRDKGLPAFTVMSCDNLQENGHVTRDAVVGYARLIDASLASWIQENVTFPCTMVDRIVPAVTTDTLDEITSLLGIQDPCGVVCEPFRQWVIEDNFVAGRPDWNLAGAEFVHDVIPFEEMKLRMLNGSHSFLAYLGYLAGYEYISDTMADPNFKKAALALMLDEQAPTLTMPKGTDLALYASSLISRYCNTNLKHRTWQIAMDGSQKLPPRLLNSIRYHLKSESDFTHLALAVAAWMRYVSSVDEQGKAIDVRDPLAASLKAISDKHGLDVSVVNALVLIDDIFAKDLIKNKVFMSSIETAYQTLLQKGAKQSVTEL